MRWFCFYTNQPNKIFTSLALIVIQPLAGPGKHSLHTQDRKQQPLQTYNTTFSHPIDNTTTRAAHLTANFTANDTDHGTCLHGHGADTLFETLHTAHRRSSMIFIYQRFATDRPPRLSTHSRSRLSCSSHAVLRGGGGVYADGNLSDRLSDAGA